MRRSIPLRALNVEFGIKDNEPNSWNGSLSIDKGEIAELRGHQFKEGESIGPNNSWTARTDPWVPSTGGMHPHELPFPHVTRVQAVGVTVYYRAPNDATISVKTVNGDFFFKPSDLPASDSMHILSTRVEVRRVPTVEAVTTDEFEDDYSVMVISEAGSLSLAWIGYKNEGDQVFVRGRSPDGSWGEITPVQGASGDLQGLAAAHDGNGALHLVWSKRSGGDWHLMSAKRTSGTWSSPQTLTSGSGNNIFPVMASDRQGSLHVAWQSARNGFSAIYYKALREAAWSAELALSDPGAANDWYPGIATDTQGTAWVVWDSYAGGSYNIRMRPVREGRAGNLMKVTDTPRYHGNPSVAVDAEDRVWVSYDEAEENWGKDTGFLLRGGAGLYQSRTNRQAGS